MPLDGTPRVCKRSLAGPYSIVRTESPIASITCPGPRVMASTPSRTDVDRDCGGLTLARDEERPTGKDRFGGRIIR